MDKTSESYTTARRQLLAKAASEAAPDAPARRAGGRPGARRPYSDEVVRNIGHTWDEWFALLDAWGAAERPHPEIARWVAGEHEVDGCGPRASPSPTSRRAASGPRAAARRAVRGERLQDGGGAGRPPLRGVHRARPARALASGATFEVRAARPGRSIRADWEDGSTRLVINFTARGDAKSQVALVHGRIPDAESAEKLRTFWRERVAVLKQLLEA